MNMTNLDSLKDADLIVVSDVHLRNCTEPTGLLFCGLLKRIAALNVKNVILLGDIFEFCFGRGRYFRRKFAPIGDLLSQLSKNGTKVYFFEGNHEFDIERLGWNGVEFVSEGSRVISISPTTQIVCSHGDLIYASASYLKFRNFVKSPTVKNIASLAPGKILDLYALRHASLSRATDRYRTLDLNALKSAMHQWLISHRCRFGFFGHFHTALDLTSDTPQGTIRLLSTESWAHPNFLALKEGKILRASLGNGILGGWQISESLTHVY